MDVLILNSPSTLPEAVRERAAPRPAGVRMGSKILRFTRSERFFHWATALPFLACLMSALILVTIYNPAPTRLFRQVFSWIHRSAGIAFVVLPILAALAHPKEARNHLRNIREAWTWRREDLKWLAMMPLASLSARFRLPEQGKFNAAEKINFMVLTATYPLYIVTGAMIWTKTSLLPAWWAHIIMAACSVPLVFGHMYMALINRGGRPGLQGMFSGFVDRDWARHHYGLWYKAMYGSGEEDASDTPSEPVATDLTESRLSMRSGPPPRQ